MPHGKSSNPHAHILFTHYVDKRLLQRSVLLCVAVVIGILIIASCARAELATDAEMQNVCRNLLTYNTLNSGVWAGSSTPEIISSQDIVDDGVLLGRCYAIAPRGFVIVPALKEMPPVKAYSTESDLDMNTEGGFAEMIREVLRGRFNDFTQYYGSLEVSASEKGDPLFDPIHRESWDRFAVANTDFVLGMAENKSVGDSAGPLLTTAWHQRAPFNNLCPMGYGDRCLVGCTAIAAAQILWYHAWPPAGLNGRRYLWYGDSSCGSAGTMRFLAACFSDNYEWTNSIANWEEICYETGIAFSMKYGACASAAATDNATWVYHDYFGYKNTAEEISREDYNPEQWYSALKHEIDANRPVLYTIYKHAIVCDGWKIFDGQFYYHMNYGWSGVSYNAWYALDHLYCNWEGCSTDFETAVRYIEPDRRAMFYADTIIGHVPMEVAFTGVSDRSVTGWTWDFGDGSKSSISNHLATHTYTTGGPFDVSLTVHSDSGDYTLERNSYMYAIADSLMAGTGRGQAGGTAVVTISGRNTLPLEMIKIPVEYGGDLKLVFDSFSTAGCLTEHFELQQLIHQDPYNRRLTLSLKAPSFDYYPFLEPGTGDLVKLYFTLPSNAVYGQEAKLEMDGYGNYLPTINGNLFGEVHIHNSIGVSSGVVTVDMIAGDVNDDDAMNLLDILYLIAFLYSHGPDPVSFESGDYNGDSGINLLDVLAMIEAVY